MPARNKSRSLQARRGVRIGNKPHLNLIHIGVIISFIVVLAAIFTFRGATWTTNSNLNMVIEGKEDTYVAVFDAKNDAITTVKIPGDTQVTAASNLGELKLKNVWQLAENEGKSGQMVADTVAKNFKFPVNAWAGEEAFGFVEGGILPPLRAFFGNYPGSLAFLDKLKLLRMGIGVREFKRVEIPLESTGFIANKKLPDGTQGYVIVRQIPDRLRVIFADEFVSAHATTIQINSATGTGDPTGVAQVLEVYGAKVASVNVTARAEYDCRVASVNAELAKRISGLFNCDITKTDPGSFDVEIWLGGKFADRF